MGAQTTGLVVHSILLQVGHLQSHRRSIDRLTPRSNVEVQPRAWCSWSSCQFGAVHFYVREVPEDPRHRRAEMSMATCCFLLRLPQSARWPRATAVDGHCSTRTSQGGIRHTAHGIWSLTDPSCNHRSATMSYAHAELPRMLFVSPLRYRRKRPDVAPAANVAPLSPSFDGPSTRGPITTTIGRRLWPRTRRTSRILLVT